MAAGYKLLNNLDQVVLTFVKSGSEFVQMRIGANEQVEVLVADISPTMSSQILNNILKIVETIDMPTPGPIPNGVTADQRAALDSADAPSVSNPVITASALVTAFSVFNPTKVYFVDKNRVDSYVESGSIDKPYKTIQAAINVANATVPTHDAAVLILVATGRYTENITLYPHISVVALDSSKNYMTEVNGTLTYADGSGGTVGSNIAGWVGIDVLQGIIFNGSNPQQLRISNCEVNRADTNAALRLNQTGSGSMVVAENVNFNNTSTGPAAEIVNGKLAGHILQINAAATSGVSVSLANASQLELLTLYARGKITTAGTSGGSIRGTTIVDAGAASPIQMDSTGTLVVAGFFLMPGVTAIASGAHAANVIALAMAA